MSKILILANFDVGLYKFRKELIQEFIKRGDQVYISLPNGDLVKPLVEMGCHFIDTPLDRRGLNPIKDFSLFMNYRRILREIKPDLVITYTIKPNIYGGIASRLCKVTYAINITGLGSTFQKDNLIKKLVTFLYKIACKNAKVVFFENEENQEIFINNKIISREKSVKLNGAGVNLEEYPFSEYPPDDGTIRFLFIGRIMKEKGIDELLEAAKRIRLEHPNVYFDLVGPMEDDYKKIIDSYNKQGIIRYHGYQEDVRPFITNCHCFVLPSYHEGMANTLLEAGAMGRPLIASDISGCREAIINENNGFIVNVRNEEALTTKLKIFIELDYEKKQMMGGNSYSYISRDFNKESVVNRTVCEVNIDTTSPIRILHIVTHMNRAGLETMLMNYYRNVDRSKIQFDFLTHRSGTKDYDSEILEMGGRIYHLPNLNPFSTRYRHVLKAFFRSHREYKIVHSHLDTMSSLPLKYAKKAGIPIRIAHAHNTSQEKNLKFIIKLFYKSRLAAQANYLFACGNESGKWMFGSKKFITLRNAIDAERFIYSKDVSFEVKNKLGLDKKLVIGHVGRFCEQKNHSFLIDIFNSIQRIEPNSVLVLIGTGELQNEIKTKVISLDLEEKVVFLGVRSDIDSLLQAMDVLVFPSIFEGLPVTLVEAQASGLKCFVSDKITQEINITNNIEFISLSESPDTWAKRIINRAGWLRENNIDHIDHAGYNIKTSYKWLENFYISESEKHD